MIRATLQGLPKNIYHLLLLLTMTIMSAEEDTELRDLVAHTLEANGVLGKIRVNLMSVICYSKNGSICNSESSHKLSHSYRFLA